jgi:hypothetical protein
MHTNKTSFRYSTAKKQTLALWLAPTLQDKRSIFTLAKYLSVYVLTLHVVAIGHTTLKLD